MMPLDDGRDLGSLEATLREHAYARIAMRDWARAAEIWAASRTVSADAAEGYAMGVLCLREAGALDAAEALARDGIARFPDESRLHLERALITFGTRDWPAARAAFAAFRARFPTLPDGYIRGAAAARELGLTAETLDLLRGGLERSPEDPRLLADFATVSALEGRRADAADAHRTLYRLEGREQDLLAQATNLSRLGDHGAAAELLRARLRDRPDSYSTLLALARLLSAAGCWTEAAERWEAVGATGLDGADEAPVRRHQAARFLASRAGGLAPGAIAAASVTARCAAHAPLARILDARWNLSVGPDRHAATGLRLSPHGEILGFEAPYRGWEMRGDAICFTDESDHVSLKLHPAGSTEHGLLRYRGRCLRTLGEEFHLALTEAGPTAGELMGRFESMGDNCEFGYIQRYFGREPMGLFRFNYVAHEPLLRGLSDGFSLLDDPDCVRLTRRTEGAEWIGLVPGYGFRYHTHRTLERDVVDLERAEHRRLVFLRDKFLDDLHDGRKILVRKCGPGEGDLRPVRDEVRRYGGCWVLEVREADDDHPSGSVAIVEDGLMRGHAEQFAPYHAIEKFVPDAWGRLCRNAVRLLDAADGE